MTRRTPTLPEILASFDAEIARAPRWVSVDRDHLQRLIDAYRAQADTIESMRAELLRRPVTEVGARVSGEGAG